MKKITLPATLLALIFGLNACIHGCTTTNIVPDWVGVYAGTMPCADCPGIQTTVELHQDSTYTIQTKYLDKSDELFTETGKFQWSAQGNSIILDNDLLKELLMEQDKLTALFDGKTESSIPAEHYTFWKADMALVGKPWKLIELNGKPVPEGQSAKEPHIVLDMYSNRFSGNTGCNNVMGSYQLQKGGKIYFSQAVATRMMCLNMTIEEQFLKLFDVVSKYSIKGNTLILKKANGVSVAKFTSNH